MNKKEIDLMAQNGDKIVEFLRGTSKVLEIKSTDTFRKAISKLLLARFLLEINDSITRKKVESFIRDCFGIKATCNKTNNPQSVVDENKLVVDLKMEKKVRLILGGKT